MPLFQPFKSATKAKDPNLVAATMQQGLLDQRAQEMKNAQRNTDAKTAIGLYNKGMGDQTPIADALRKMTTPDAELDAAGDMAMAEGDAMAADAGSYGSDPMAEGFAEMDYSAPDTMQTSIDAATSADLADEFSVGEDLSELGELGEGAEDLSELAELGEGAEDLAALTEGADAAAGAADAGGAAGGSMAGVGDLLQGDLEAAIKKQLVSRALMAAGPWGAAAGALYSILG